MAIRLSDVGLRMIKIFATALALICASPLFAQSDVAADNSIPSSFLRLNDLEARGAVQLSASELRALLPGAKVKNLTRQGSTRYWTNDSSGDFVASTDGKGGHGRAVAGVGRSNTGVGTWHLADNGTYCVQIEWKGSSEQWCRYIFRMENKYYGVKSLKDGAAVAYEYDFTK